jgi:hypothetical protein
VSKLMLKAPGHHGFSEPELVTRLKPRRFTAHVRGRTEARSTIRQEVRSLVEFSPCRTVFPTQTGSKIGFLLYV